MRRHPGQPAERKCPDARDRQSKSTSAKQRRLLLKPSRYPIVAQLAMGWAKRAVRRTVQPSWNCPQNTQAGQRRRTLQWSRGRPILNASYSITCLDSTSHSLARCAVGARSSRDVLCQERNGTYPRLPHMLAWCPAFGGDSSAAMVGSSACRLSTLRQSLKPHILTATRTRPYLWTRGPCSITTASSRFCRPAAPAATTDSSPQRSSCPQYLRPGAILFGT